MPPRYSRQILGDFARGQTGDKLPPHEGAGSEEQTPQPLLYREPRRAERHASELNYHNLEKTMELIKNLLS